MLEGNAPWIFLGLAVLLLVAWMLISHYWNPIRARLGHDDLEKHWTEAGEHLVWASHEDLRTRRLSETEYPVPTFALDMLCDAARELRSAIWWAENNGKKTLKGAFEDLLLLIEECQRTADLDAENSALRRMKLVRMQLRRQEAGGAKKAAKSPGMEFPPELYPRLREYEGMVAPNVIGVEHEGEIICLFPETGEMERELADLEAWAAAAA